MYFTEEELELLRLIDESPHNVETIPSDEIDWTK